VVADHDGELTVTSWRTRDLTAMASAREDAFAFVEPTSGEGADVPMACVGRA
jgi:hypothetical protein